MSTFTIDGENKIMAHAELPNGGDESHSFSSAKEQANFRVSASPNVGVGMFFHHSDLLADLHGVQEREGDRRATDAVIGAGTCNQ